jgi:hypothetical protein
MQRLQTNILIIIGNFPKGVCVRDMHVAFHIPYVCADALNYAGNRQKPFIIMKMKMFAVLDKAKRDTESIRDLNLEAVTCKTIQVNMPW